jgi:putative ubiquitin-RnfH superfamily antitoxin RatB of RatAB toxin-antitoxin module
MAEERVRVTVCYSPAPRRVLEWAVSVAAGAVVLEALQVSGVSEAAPQLDLKRAPVGIWGRKAQLSQRLRDGDRIEVLRTLQVDPKVARRERFRKQGARTAGLFARRGRPAVPGQGPDAR